MHFCVWRDVTQNTVIEFIFSLCISFFFRVIFPNELYVFNFVNIEDPDWIPQTTSCLGLEVRCYASKGMFPIRKSTLYQVAQRVIKLVDFDWKEQPVTSLQITN